MGASGLRGSSGQRGATSTGVRSDPPARGSVADGPAGNQLPGHGQHAIRAVGRRQAPGTPLRGAPPSSVPHPGRPRKCFPAAVRAGRIRSGPCATAVRATGEPVAAVWIDTLAAVAAGAPPAPVIGGLFPRLPVPQVVLLLAGGMLLGPDVLAVGSARDVQVLADVGLGFVFLLAGYEVDLRLMREDAGRRAVIAWTTSLVLAIGVVGGLAAAGLVKAFLPIALGLTTTALGTLLPVLREKGLLRGRLGGYLLAAGGVGELFPVLAIALFLGTQGRVTALASLAAVGLLAAVLALLRRGVRDNSRLAGVIRAGQNETAQITLRGTILLLLTLVAVTDRFHLDAVLGAFLAGIVLRRWVGTAAPVLESKLDAVGYGFFVPLFFVYSGMGLDLHAIADAPLRLVLF